jgi:hypothetical protein
MDLPLWAALYQPELEPTAQATAALQKYLHILDGEVATMKRDVAARRDQLQVTHLTSGWGIAWQPLSGMFSYAWKGR